MNVMTQEVTDADLLETDWHGATFFAGAAGRLPTRSSITF
jgi:hypothetical protein